MGTDSTNVNNSWETKTKEDGWDYKDGGLWGKGNLFCLLRQKKNVYTQTKHTAQKVGAVLEQRKEAEEGWVSWLRKSSPMAKKLGEIGHRDL